MRLDPNGIPAVIHVIEPTGSETQVLAHIGEAPLLCALRERITAKPGETLMISPDPALAHIFIGEHGARLEPDYGARNAA